MKKRYFSRLRLRTGLLLFQMATLTGCFLNGPGKSDKEVKDIYARPADASRFISIDGVRFHYRDQGKGPLILAIHGVADSLHTWEKWSEIMTQNFRVVRFDLPGFGLSDPLPGQNYRPEMIIHYISRFVEEMGLEKFHLAGNSLGGLLSWMYSLEHPEQVSTLTLIDTAGYPFALPWIISMAKNPALAQISRLYTPRIITTMATRQVFSSPEKAPAVEIERFHDLLMREGNRESYLAIFQSIIKYSPILSHLIKDITHPTLVLWGDSDHWIPKEHLELWRRDLPHAEFKILKATGHVPQLESPIKTASEVTRFLDKYLAKEATELAQFSFRERPAAELEN